MDFHGNCNSSTGDSFFGGPSLGKRLRSLQVDAFTAAQQRLTELQSVRGSGVDPLARCRQTRQGSQILEDMTTQCVLWGFRYFVLFRMF